jgi:nicotinamide mononucleotide transporter
MRLITTFFDLNNIAFTLFNYPMSWLELTGTVTGLLAVWLSAREHIINWAIGLINIICFYVIFYRSALYSDMFLQIFFFGTGVYGWYEWSRRNTQDLPKIKIDLLKPKQRFLMILFIIINTIVLGHIISKLNSWYPHYFPQPAAFPIADTAIMVMSMVANVLMARKKMEAWYLWVAVDILAPMLYFQKKLYFLSIEYVIFGIIAAYGLVTWQRIYKQQQMSL